MNTAVDMVSLSTPVKRFVSQARQALIDRRWQDAQSGETFECASQRRHEIASRCMPRLESELFTTFNAEIGFARSWANRFPTRTWSLTGAGGCKLVDPGRLGFDYSEGRRPSITRCGPHPNVNEYA